VKPLTLAAVSPAHDRFSNGSLPLENLNPHFLQSLPLDVVTSLGEWLQGPSAHHFRGFQLEWLCRSRLKDRHQRRPARQSPGLDDPSGFQSSQRVRRTKAGDMDPGHRCPAELNRGGLPDADHQPDADQELCCLARKRGCGLKNVQSNRPGDLGITLDAREAGLVFSVMRQIRRMDYPTVRFRDDGGDGKSPVGGDTESLLDKN